MDNKDMADLSQFGYIELEEAGQLLKQVKEIDCSDGLKLMFNSKSGYVFVTDNDYRTWMLNDGKIAEWFNCPYCGHEGFKEDMGHEPQDKECSEYLKEIGVLN